MSVLLGQDRPILTQGQDWKGFFSLSFPFLESTGLFELAGRQRGQIVLAKAVQKSKLSNRSLFLSYVHRSPRLPVGRRVSHAPFAGLESILKRKARRTKKEEGGGGSGEKEGEKIFIPAHDATRPLWTDFQTSSFFAQQGRMRWLLAGQKPKKVSPAAAAVFARIERKRKRRRGPTMERASERV